CVPRLSCSVPFSSYNDALPIYKDEDGYFWFQGRLDEVFKTPNERIGPFEIESKLIEHPAVHEAGVIAKPDPIKGEEIKAFITLKDRKRTRLKSSNASTSDAGSI